MAQTLYAITLVASRALSVVGSSDADQLQRMVHDILKLANGGQAELRALVSDLRSEELPQPGLLDALASLADELRRHHGIDVRLSLAPGADVPMRARHALVRIAREALLNAAKHANAARVDLVLAVDSAEVVLTIADDGRGFDPAASYPGHFGLASMRERAAAVAGSVELISGAGRGTQVNVRVPRARR